MSHLSDRFSATDTAAIEHYREHGYVVIRQLVPRELPAEVLARTDDVLAGRCPPLGIHHFGAGSDRGPNDPGRLNRQIVIIDFPALDPVFRRCAECPAVTAVAARLMGCERATIFQLQAMAKEAGCDNPTPWHQDDAYWRLGQAGAQAVTAWIPLLPTTAANGTMWILPDSHQGAIHEHQQAGGISDYRTIAAPIDTSRLVPLELAPGDVSFHHQKTTHGAYANAGRKRRVAIGAHYADVPNPWELIGRQERTR